MIDPNLRLTSELKSDWFLLRFNDSTNEAYQKYISKARIYHVQNDCL